MKQEEFNNFFSIPIGCDVVISTVFYQGIERKNFYSSTDVMNKPITRERIKVEYIDNISPIERNKSTGEMWALIRHKYGANYCKLLIKKT